MYSACGERYRLQRVVKAPERYAAWLAQGIAFHETAEYWERRGRKDPLEVLEKWYEEAWWREINAAMEREPDVNKWLVAGRKKPDKDLEDRHAAGWQQAQDYVEFALADKRWRLLEFYEDEPAVEVGFDIMLGSVRVVGYIDQIIEWEDGRITVRDMKTGSKKPASARQLGLYAIAVEELIGHRPVWGDFYMAKDNELSTPVDLSRYTREYLTEQFEGFASAAEADVWLANPGDGCRICGVQEFCRVMGTQPNAYPLKREEARAPEAKEGNTIPWGNVPPA
jgi:putative RecB family exonuclease